MHKTDGIRLILGFYFAELRRHWRYAIAIVILVPVGVFLNNFAGAYIISSVIDYFSTHGNVPLDQLWPVFHWQIIGFLISALLGELIVWRLILWSVWRLEIKMGYALYNRCFEYLSQQSSQFHAEKFGGSLVSQTNKFVSTYSLFANTLAWSLLPLLSTMIFTLVILGIRAPWFALGLAVIAVLFTFISALSYGKITHLNEASSVADTKLSGQIADMISNILAVKAFSAEKREAHRFHNLNASSAGAAKNLLNATTRRDIGFASSLTALLLMMFISILIGQAVAGITVGTMVLMLTYSMNMFGQLWNINGIARSFNQGYGNALPMAQILTENVAIKDPKYPQVADFKKGEIRFGAVDFKFHDSHESLFKNFSLHIKPGQRVGLVGPSGSGKTTITNLILRFLDVDAGSITIDGVNIASVTQADLRAQIAYVPQQPLLFHRSLRENIAYGNPDATEADILKAAKQAHALEFIKKLPEGLDTLVGERGVKLSGGQRQRVAIARAILKNAPILVLDEATSALDSESERLIQDALEKLMKGRTSIVVAHRLSTIASLDRVIVLQNGAIAEDGSHEELLRRRGTYAKLWRHQSGGFIEE